jgi:predicted O-methyltransferase YrrM
MTANGNIFACLVHENQECVIDLIRNLRYLDPNSLILLYNGGSDPRLLDSGFPFERHGAIVHPQPQPVPWGRLHPFALGCMQFALDHFPFRTLTVVDSDQLAVRSDYSAHLAGFLNGRSGVGMLGNSSVCQSPNTRISPAQHAHKEIDLWRPFLRRFPDGEKKFVCWSFWPSTVFTAEAARDLTQLFATDNMLQQIMARTKIWASEEIILPTLVALLGYQILTSPCSYEYVQYRRQYTLQQLQAAHTRNDIFWLHPVPRSYNHPLRNYLRTRFSNYENGLKQEGTMPVSKLPSDAGLLLTWPILNRMKQIEGWLAEDEADLLIAATALALTRISDAQAVVEVGSYCGRSTCVIGSVVKALRPSAKVYAIDPHDGRVGALDRGIQVTAPTLGKLTHNLNAAGLADLVTIIASPPWEVAWDQPTSLLLIDGLHDYANVARDFYHFEPSLVPGGYVAFHDYADYYPGVKTFVNELLQTRRYEKVHCASSMILLRRIPETEQCRLEGPQPPDEAKIRPRCSNPSRVQSDPVAGAALSGPLVSCIMPTADRRSLVPQAIQYFLRQDYPKRELIILDDGADSIADLIPENPQIRYVRMAEKRTMGAKHNMACEMAQGEIIVHWDDDDWMADRRLSYQVGELLRQPPMTLCGLARLIYYDPRADRAWEYIYPQSGQPWVCGNSFCYRKQFWEKHRFPAKNEGADTVWVWGLRGQKVVALPDHTFYVAIIHPKNTSPKRIHDPRWHQYSSQGIRDLMQDDLDFYKSMFV